MPPGFVPCQQALLTPCRASACSTSSTPRNVGVRWTLTEDAIKIESPGSMGGAFVDRRRRFASTVRWHHDEKAHRRVARRTVDAQTIVRDIHGREA
jgi:hypothetical protein